MTAPAPTELLKLADEIETYSKKYGDDWNCATLSMSWERAALVVAALRQAASPNGFEVRSADVLAGLDERLDRLLLTSNENERFVLSTESAKNIVGIVREWIRGHGAAQASVNSGVCNVCSLIAPLRCGPSRFGPETWACEACWNPSEGSEVPSAEPLSPQVCAGGVDPGWDECPKCGATMDDACAFSSTDLGSRS